MPQSSTFNVIHLGQYSTLDPTEGNYVAENARDLVGHTFDGFSRDDVQSWSAVSYSSNDSNSASSPSLNQTYNQDNNFGDDTFQITDAAGASTTYIFDSVVMYDAVLTYADGTTADVHLLLVQDTTGNIWVAPPSSYSPDAAALGTEPIQAISLTGITQPPTSGSNPGDSTLGLFFNREVISPIETVPCFAEGTMILTDMGEVAVENLQVGDMIVTRDRGSQPLRWINSRHCDAADLQTEPRLRPIRVAAGAIADQIPAQDLLLSPQHRVLIRSNIAQRMFGADEVLVAAKQLLILDGVDIDDAIDGVTYFHFICDQHEVVFSNGAETETLYAGKEILRGIGQAAADELFTIFPELQDEDAPEAARLLASGRMGRKLVMRHKQNNKPLQLS